MAMSSDKAYHEKERQLKGRKEKRKIKSSSTGHSRDKFEERLDFKFYDFKALEIEKGWNQLFVSIISMETGETIAKSGKALVQNGQCHWEDSMLSTIWISDYSHEDNEACLLKLLVAMGSPRFGTLGEATINLASYIVPETCTASLPLIQHGSHGAILQVKIQCLTPRRNYRKYTNSYGDEMSVGYDDVDSISNASDTTFKNIFYPGELSTKRRGPQMTCSDHDVGSLDSSFPSWIENFPQQSNVNGWKTNVQEKQDTTCSKDGPHSLYDTSSLGTQIQDKMEDFGQISHANDSASTRSVCSSKDMLAAAQVTIELLHGEVKMWEESTRKLTTDVERLRKELHKKSKHKKDLEMELSASRKESGDLKEEIQRLTAMVKQNDSRNLRLQTEEMDNVIKELKDEINYQKGLNYDLEVKLNRTQESNIDIVSIFRNFEKMVEKQKMEIAELSRTNRRFDGENNSRGIEDSEEEDFSLSIDVLPEKMRKEFYGSGYDLSTNENAIRCLHEGIELQEFRNVEIERQVMQEKQKNMQSTNQFLEKALDDKDHEMQNARHFMAQTFEENDAKWSNRLFEKEKQIANFEKKLYEGFNAFSNEILALTQRVQDLEAEFRERYGESKEDLVSSFPSNILLFNFDTAIKITEAFLELYKQLHVSVKNLKGQKSLLTFTKNKSCFDILELSKDAGKIDLRELTDVILCTTIQLNKLLESKATSLENEINPHDEVRNSSKIESSDDDQHALFALKEEVAQLSERISGLEAEVRYLNEEKELTHLALENSENIVTYLKAEIKRMENINESRKVDLKIMGESMQKRWTEAQEECGFLKGGNLKLQAINENLIQVSKTLQATNGVLRMQNLALHNRYAVLESKLGESQIAFSDIMKLVEDLECKFTSMLEEIALKEKTINVDIEALLQESVKQDERFIIEERFLTQMYMEKAAEVSNLQREVEHLTDQVSDIFDRHKIIASNVVLHVYDLCSDKAMTEAALQEEQEKLKLYEAKLDNLQAEYEVTVHNYNEELATMTENQENLMVKHEKVVLLLGNSKSNEEKLKGIVRRLVVELKTSELERLQATEEIFELEVQLQKTEVLQNELFILKRSLYEVKFECRRLETSYQMLSLEYDVLKAEKVSCMQRLSTTEEVTSELEDCKRSKVELEDKIFRLEWDLTTKEASWHSNAQLKYELAQVTRENGELFKKKEYLQQENEDYQKKVKVLEEKLKQKDEKQNEYIDKECSTSTTDQDDLKFLQVEDNCSSIKSSERQLLSTATFFQNHNKFLTK
uniref:Desmoplakin-like n=1 Tax=Cicer arietinum TaxID=3827 RepID=A0A1S3E2N2_CICAR|nr:desmoplakin-like [Cicer arietinum]